MEKGGERYIGGGGEAEMGLEENRQAVSPQKICYCRGNAMWQFSMATAGGDAACACARLHVKTPQVTRGKKIKPNMARECACVRAGIRAQRQYSSF